MGNRLTPVVLNLLIINVVVFILDLVLNRQLLVEFGLRYIEADTFAPWQFITYMFLHGGEMHIFSNMLGLFFFGPWLEQVLTSRRFFVFYMVAGLGAGVLQELVMYIEFYQYPVAQQEYLLAAYNSPYAVTIGASGAIFGVLVAFAMIFPNIEMRLIFLPFFGIKSKYFVLIYIVYELYAGVYQSGASNVAHFAHLGGALIGFLLIKYWGIRRQY